MKKFSLHLMLILTFFCFSQIYVHSETLVEGSMENPYLLSSEEDLKNIALYPSAHFKLICDITLTESWESITDFTGTLDGNGFSIYNFVSKTTTEKNVSTYGGLVHYNNGIIKNLGIYITDLGITTRTCTKLGTLADINNGIIENCFVIGNIDIFAYIANRISFNYVGGLAGENSDSGTIINSYYIGDIQCTNQMMSAAYCGGITAVNSGQISNCFATGSMSAISSDSSCGNAYCGGLVASNIGKIDCGYSSGSVYTFVYDPYETTYSGGLAGYSEGEISNSYSCSSVSAKEYNSYTNGDYLGGVVGYCSGKVINCYATGSVAACNSNGAKGGIIGGKGNTVNFSVSNSYYDKATTGCRSEYGIACTTEDMQTASTFVNWDFENIWTIKAENYPYHKHNKKYNPTIYTISDVSIESNDICSIFDIAVKKITGSNSNHVLITAVYDVNDRLTSVYITTTNAENTKASVEVSNEKNITTGNKIKTFIWEDTTNVTPLSNTYTKIL